MLIVDGQSHLTRGAWIEIPLCIILRIRLSSRTSHEVRGLKYMRRHYRYTPALCRTSHEVRGLKYYISL